MSNRTRPAIYVLLLWLPMLASAIQIEDEDQMNCDNNGPSLTLEDISKNCLLKNNYYGMRDLARRSKSVIEKAASDKTREYHQRKKSPFVEELSLESQIEIAVASALAGTFVRKECERNCHRYCHTGKKLRWEPYQVRSDSPQDLIREIVGKFNVGGFEWKDNTDDCVFKCLKIIPRLL